jgi:hypothetical protein
MRDAAQLPGAPRWLLESIAGDILMKGGDRASSRRMWRQIYEQAEEGLMRENARVRLQILDALDQAEALEGAVREYEHRFGHRPAALVELRAAGLLRVPLHDETGVPFAYDPATGRVTPSHGSSLWRPQMTEAAPPAGGSAPAPTH